MDFTFCSLCSWLRSRYNNYWKKSIKKHRKNNEKLDNQVIEQIKRIRCSKYGQPRLTSEQQSLIDKLIPNVELKERYKTHGLCKECYQPNTFRNFSSKEKFVEAWCQECNSKHFNQEFDEWTSSSSEIDEFIQNYQLNATQPREVLEWIPYEQFENIEYLAEGGFGKVYKAKWINSPIRNWDIDDRKWNRKSSNEFVVLKSLNHSQNITVDFLREITYYKLCNEMYDHVLSCYGISQDPQKKNYVMVMEYMKEGNLRQYLKNKHNKLSFKNKLWQLRTIADGLKKIHDRGLIHRDFHSGNILNSYHIDQNQIECYIADLGLCRPANETNQEKIYGVLPYVAPEVLKEKSYTPAADVYSWGIIAYEILTGLSPYHHIKHNELLALCICRGLRPQFQIKIPQLLEDLIKRCWDANPLQRPTTNELIELLDNWKNEIRNKKKQKEFYLQYEESIELNRSLSPNSHKTNPQAIYTSRLLDFKNLPEPQNSKEVNDKFYEASKSMKFDITDFCELLENKDQQTAQILQDNLPNLPNN